MGKPPWERYGFQRSYNLLLEVAMVHAHCTTLLSCLLLRLMIAGMLLAKVQLQ